jgi:hypothetical protein
MTEFANPRQRASFRLRAALTRDGAFDAAAGVLMRAKPDACALESLSIYPPGEGGSEDTDVVTFDWELSYEIRDERDWDWGSFEQERLAGVLERELGAPSS